MKKLNLNFSAGMIFPEHYQLDQKKMLEDWNTLYIEVESQFELIEKLGKALELADEINKKSCDTCWFYFEAGACSNEKINGMIDRIGSNFWTPKDFYCKFWKGKNE
jgi:hypothetical protein